MRFTARAAATATVGLMVVLGGCGERGGLGTSGAGGAPPSGGAGGQVGGGGLGGETPRDPAPPVACACAPAAGVDVLACDGQAPSTFWGFDAPDAFVSAQ